MGTTPDFDDWAAARGPSLLRLAYVLTGSQEAAVDTVEDALSHALPRWRRTWHLEDPDAHLRRLVVDANDSRLRRFRRRRAPMPTRSAAEVATGIRIKDHDVVWRACRTLPAEQRAAVVLRYYEDLEEAEIAELTGAREGSVRLRVSRGMAALEAELGAMADVESGLRASLAERAEEAVGASALAAGARARLRRRRTTIATAVTGAAVTAAAAFAFAFVSGGGVARPPTPQPVDVPEARYLVRDPAPKVVTRRDPLQEVTWRGIRFAVPSQWQPALSTAWCTQGKDPAGVVPHIALPGQSGPKIACTPSSGYGVSVGPAAAFDPVYDSRHVWQYDTEGIEARALHPDGAWLSSWYDDEWVVTIATPDPGLTSRIAQSVRGEEVDANGCAVVFDEAAARTTPGPRGVGAALCRYSIDGELEASGRLSYVEVDAALAAIAAAPDLPGGDHCSQQQGGWVTLTPAGESAYFARYETEGAGSCRDGVESTAQGQERGPRGYFELTVDVRTAFGLGDLSAD